MLSVFMESVPTIISYWKHKVDDGQTDKPFDIWLIELYNEQKALQNKQALERKKKRKK